MVIIFTLECDVDLDNIITYGLLQNVGIPVFIECVMFWYCTS